MVARRGSEADGAEGSAGRVDSPYDVRVADEEGEEVPAGTVGELLVRPLLPWTAMQEYAGMPEATIRTFRNLWFHTGDAVRIDGDGSVWFVDRIRRRGENVASADVERVLLEHPAVEGAAAIAVPSEEIGGEDEIKAVLVARDGAPLDAAQVWA